MARKIPASQRRVSLSQIGFPNRSQQPVQLRGIRSPCPIFCRQQRVFPCRCQLAHKVPVFLPARVAATALNSRA